MQPKLLQKENIHSKWMCQSAQFRHFLKPATAEHDLLTFPTSNQHPPYTPTIGKLRQNDPKLQASLGYVRLQLKKKLIGA